MATAHLGPILWRRIQIIGPFRLRIHSLSCSEALRNISKTRPVPLLQNAAESHELLLQVAHPIEVRSLLPGGSNSIVVRMVADPHVLEAERRSPGGNREPTTNQKGGMVRSNSRKVRYNRGRKHPRDEVGEVTGDQLQSWRCHEVTLKTTEAQHKRKKDDLPECSHREKKQELGMSSEDELMEVELIEGSPEKITKVGRHLAADIQGMLIALLKEFSDVFAFSADDLTGIDPGVAEHRLNIDSTMRPVKQKRRHFGAEPDVVIEAEVEMLLKAGHVRPIQFPEWLSNSVMADEMAKCYILASLSNVLQHQHQSMNTAVEMLLNLKELFGHQSRAARQEAMRVLMNMTMREGTPVREHVLAMMAQLNELEVLGAFIDGETQVDIVFQSLPKSFEQFRLNYNMNKMLMTLPEHVSELQSAEGLFRQKTQAMVAQRGEASISKDPKGKKRKKSAGKGKAVMNDAQPRQNVKKPKGKCHNYQQKGHWKANCPSLKKFDKCTPFALVIETCLAVLSTSTWCVDTRATDHVCNSLQG
ncbi:Unknown protein, partial [Striga hermonthica]